MEGGNVVAYSLIFGALALFEEFLIAYGLYVRLGMGPSTPGVVRDTVFLSILWITACAALFLPSRSIAPLVPWMFFMTRVVEQDADQEEKTQGLHFDRRTPFRVRAKGSSSSLCHSVTSLGSKTHSQSGSRG